MKYLFLLVFLASSSCVSEKKAQSHAFAFYQQHPLALAVHCLEKFPVQKHYVAGKTTFHEDTLYTQSNGLSQQQEETNGKKTKTIIRYLSRVDTIYEENTAKISIYQNENNNLKTQLTLCTQAEKQSTIISLKRLWLLILMTVLCFIQAFLSLKRFFS